MGSGEEYDKAITDLSRRVVGRVGTDFQTVANVVSGNLFRLLVEELEETGLLDRKRFLSRIDATYRDDDPA